MAFPANYIQHISFLNETWHGSHHATEICIAKHFPNATQQNSAIQCLCQQHTTPQNWKHVKTTSLIASHFHIGWYKQWHRCPCPNLPEIWWSHCHLPRASQQPKCTQPALCTVKSTTQSCQPHETHHTPNWTWHNDSLHTAAKVTHFQWTLVPVPMEKKHLPTYTTTLDDTNILLLF